MPIENSPTGLSDAEVGDRVRVRRGKHAGERGVITVVDTSRRAAYHVKLDSGPNSWYARDDIDVLPG